MRQDDTADSGRRGRLATLQRRTIEDRAAATALDRLTRLATRLLHVPMACIVTAEADRQTVVSASGLPDPPHSWGGLALTQAVARQLTPPWTPLLLDDPRAYLAEHAGVAAADLGVAAYASAPLITADGAIFGMLCAADSAARTWTAEDSADLTDLAAIVVQTIEMRYDLLARDEAAATAQADIEQDLRNARALLADARERLDAELAERKVLVDALVEVQRRESLDVLAAGIAHSFNNLLSTILGNAEMALLELAQDSPAQASIAPITIAAQRAAALTRQLLVYAGRGIFLMQPLNLNEVVADVIDLLGVSVARRATLIADLAPQLPTVVADAAQIRQAITNLVTNAVEAIGDADGTIGVTTSVQELDQAALSTTYHAADLLAGTYVSLAVSDNGCGMDAATSARIFDPFFTTKFTGRGLGLAAVLGIVRGLHGAVRVESTPGRGTTIHVIFPSYVGETTDAEDSAG